LTGSFARLEVINMMRRSAGPEILSKRDIAIPAGSVQLEGELIVPDGASGLRRVFDGT